MLGPEDPWRRKWHPTPVFLPGEFHGQRSLEGHSPWGRKESDAIEHTHQNIPGPGCRLTRSSPPTPELPSHRPQKREAGLSKPPPGMGSMGRVLMGFTPVGVPQKSAEASANRGLQAGGPRWRRTSLTSRGQESEAEPGPPTTHKSPKPGLGRGDLLTPATTTKYS